MAEMGTATVELKADPELTALVDRLANLVGQFAGCAIRVLDLQPGDVIVLESSQRLSERAYEWLTKQAKEQWPNNRFIILDNCKFAGVTREGPCSGLLEDSPHDVSRLLTDPTAVKWKHRSDNPIVQAAIEVFSGHYADFEGPIKFPDWPSYCPDKAKLKALADALNAAGYEWETLT